MRFRVLAFLFRGDRCAGVLGSSYRLGDGAVTPPDRAIRKKHIRSDRYRSGFCAHCLRLTACLGVVVIASEVGAGALFPTSISFAAGDSPRSVAVADLDGDTVPDVVTANERSDDVSVLLGNGDGSFQAAVAFAAGDDPQSVVVADLDGDTVPDVVTANDQNDRVSVLLGNGDGSFRAAVFSATGDSPQSVVVADLDGDTVPDLVTANQVQ